MLTEPYQPFSPATVLFIGFFAEKGRAAMPASFSYPTAFPSGQSGAGERSVQ